MQPSFNSLVKSAGILLGAVLILMGSLMILSPTTVEAACPALPSDKGQVTFSVTIPSSGTYRVWTRLFPATLGQSKVELQVDQATCNVLIGQNSSLPANQLTWVDYGTATTSKINLNLTAGSHTVIVAGVDPSVGIDKILFLIDATCTPTGDGSNCTPAATPTPIPTPVSGGGSVHPTPTPLTVGSSGGTIPVSGKINLAPSIRGDTTKYYVDGKLVTGNSLDTTNLSDGTHTIEAVTTNTAGKVTSRKTQTIQAQNGWQYKLVAGLKQRLPIAVGGVAALILLIGGGLFWWKSKLMLKQGKLTAPTMPNPDRANPSTPAFQSETFLPDKTIDGGVWMTHPSSKSLLPLARAPFTWRRAAPFAGGAALIGIVTTVFVFAAGAFFAFEPESGTLSGGAKVVAVSGASGGSVVQFGAGVTPTPTPTPTPAPTPTPSPGSCSGASNAIGGADPWGGCWPSSTNTGVPAGTTLTTYPDSGACHLTTANVSIDAKTINCDVLIEAPGIKITRSHINGRIINTTDSAASASVTISDSVIDGGQQETFPSVSYENITLLRVEVLGGQHSVQCYGLCVITDSYLHGQYLPATSAGHVNAFISNGGNGFTFTHNTLWCTATPTSSGGGCTADASLFGDFGTISDAHFDKNLFVADNATAGYCIQAGYNPGKAYPIPSNVTVTNNIFQRGANGHCGIYGVATAYYNGNGDVWTGNAYDNGAIIPMP